MDITVLKSFIDKYLYLVLSVQIVKPDFSQSNHYPSIIVMV